MLQETPLLGCALHAFGAAGLPLALELLPGSCIYLLQIPIYTPQDVPAGLTPPYLTSLSSQEEVGSMRNRLQDCGLSIVSCQVHTGDPSLKAVRDVLGRKFRIARELGATRVIGDAGAASSPEHLQQILKGLRLIGDLAAEHELFYCCDILPGLGLNHRELAYWLGEVNHPHIQANLDTGSLYYYNELTSLDIALSKVCHLTQHVQLRDCTGEFGRAWFPALGEGGGVDFFRTREIFRNIGQPAPFVIDFGGGEEEQLTREEIARRLHVSLRTLRQCGYQIPTASSLDRDKEV